MALPTKFLSNILLAFYGFCRWPSLKVTFGFVGVKVNFRGGGYISGTLGKKNCDTVPLTGGGGRVYILFKRKTFYLKCMASVYRIRISRAKINSFNNFPADQLLK